MKRWVGWLRGINVGAAGKGRKAVPMAALRELAEGLGWRDVQTYIQSGNVVFDAAGAAARLAPQLEQSIVERFGFAVPVVVVAHAELAGIATKCPFAAVVDERPNLVHVGFTAGKLARSVATALAPYCQNGERVAVQGPVLWVDFANGVARSKLTPAVFDRVVGASVTFRNVKTLRAVQAM